MYVYLWDIVQRRVIILTDFSGQRIGSIIRSQISFEDGIDRLSRNVGKELPLYAV